MPYTTYSINPYSGKRIDGPREAWVRSLRLLVGGLAISLVVWAFSGVQFRDAEGFLEGSFCVPLSIGIALLILTCAINTSLNRFAFWFALALIGQATALQMVEAGPLIHYQHYRLVDRVFTGSGALFLACLSVQVTALTVGLWSRWPKIRNFINNSFKPWQLLVVGLVFSIFSAAPSRQASTYLAELVFATLIQLVNLGTIVMAVWALPQKTCDLLSAKFRRLFKQTKEKPRKAWTWDLFVLLAAMWVVLIAGTLSLFFYEAHPHVPDEVIYHYHARYFAEGMLTTPAPPIPEAFSIYLIPYKEGRWYSPFPPGWPAVLAIGFLLGLPWLVNPVLGGLNILLTYALLREIYSLRTARLSVLLLCVSPWYIFMSMNFMAHTATLTFALVAALGIVWARNTQKTIWAVLAGCAVGITSLVRPLDGLAVMIVLSLWAWVPSGQRMKVSSFAAFIVGTVFFGAMILPYNNALTGDSTVFPLTAYYEEYFSPNAFSLGFGPDRGLDWPIDPWPGYSMIEAGVNATLNMFSMNVELFGWSTGSLMILALFLASGVLLSRDHLMLVPVLVISGLYSLFWYSGGPDFGPRYWYLMVVPLVALTARGIHFLETITPRMSGSSAFRNGRVLVLVFSLCSLSLVNYIPWRALDKYHHYLKMRPDLRQLAKRHRFGKSLILIRGNAHPDYSSAWTYNPLNVQVNVPLYAFDRGPELRAALLQAFPDRPVWIVDGPSVTQAGFRVVDGPLSPAQVSKE